MSDEIDRTWVALKQATYCKRHGERIKGHINGEPLCQVCINTLWKAIEVQRETESSSQAKSNNPKEKANE